jgi:5-methylthioadenosine/S-adenosylhomocysteine deaminase
MAAIEAGNRTCIRNVLLLDAERPEGFRGPVTIVIQGGLVTSIVDGADCPAWPGDIDIDGTGRLAAPGLVNAHTHSQSSTLPGFGDRLSHPAFMWLTQAHTARRTKDEIRLAVMLTAYGLITTGTSAAIDHFPGQRFTAEDLDAVLAAWAETGLRVGLAIRFFDGAFDDIIPAALPAELRAELADVELLKPQPLEGLADLMEGAIQTWHTREGRLSILPAPSNPDRCSDAALLLCAEIAERHDLGIHTHLLETRRQAEIAISRYGTSALAHLETLGVLSDRWSCAHSIWLSDADIDLMAARGITAVLNPESNARIGTGLAPIPTLRRRGVPLALGTDGAGSNDNLALHEAMRAIATAHRVGEPDRRNWLSARDALAIATTGGARALRRPSLGQIVVGGPADIALYRLDAPWWMTINDAITQFVFAETGAAVDMLIVAGETLLRDGRPTRFDPAELRRELDAMSTSLRHRNADLFAAAARVADLS